MSGPWEKYAAQPKGPWSRYAAPAPEAPRTGLTAGEALKDGFAAVGHGAAKLVGSPVDLVTGALNLASTGINKVAGTEIPAIRKPFLGSESLSGAYDAAADAVGMTPPAYEDLPTRNKAARNVAEVGTMLGLGGIGGALRAAPGVAAPTAGSVAADLVAPAREMAAKTLAGDAGAVLGTAAAQTAVDENKDVLAQGGVAGQLIGALAPMAGGVAGVGLSLPATAAASAARQRLRPDPTLPVDPMTNTPYPARLVDRAADQAQGAALDPRQAATDLRANEQNLRDLGVERLPTAGVLSDDPGLVGMENRFRNSPENKGAARLVDADRHVDTEAANRLASIGEGSDPRAPGNFVQQRADTMRAEPRQAMAAAEQEAAVLEAQRAADAAQLGQYADGRMRDGAALRLDEQVVQQGLRRAVAQKNELFAAIDPAGALMRPTAPLAERVAAIRRGAQDLPPELRNEVLPERFLAAIDNMAPRVEERAVSSPILGPDGAPITRTERVNTGGSGEISMRTVTEMVPLLSSAEAQARKAGQYGLADNIRALRQEMGREPERLAAEGNATAATAVDNYRDGFAPTWAPGPGDEAARFRKDFNADPVGRSTTAPSETAGRFLSSPEKAQALARILNSTPNPEVGFAAARDYVMGDLAVSGVLDRSGQINLRYLRSWLSNNGPVAEAIPGLRDELEGVARQAGDRQGQAQRLAADLDAAKGRMKLTEEQIQQGVLGRLLGRDPAKLVESLVQSKDPQMSLREAVGILKGDPNALRGFAAAIGEYIGGKASNTNVKKTLDNGQPVSPAKLEALMATLGDSLAEVLPPGEMQKLRATQAQLRPRQNLGVKAVVGSDTNAQQQNMGAAGALAANIPGLGSSGRMLKAMAAIIPDRSKARVDGLLLNAMERPDVLANLLTRDTRKAPMANFRGNASIGAILGLRNAQQ